MLDYTINNEVEARGIIPKTVDCVMPRYRNLKALWRMQSSFSHGDQAIITDVYDFKDGDKPVLKFKRGPIGPYLLIFDAFLYAMELLESFEIIHDGLFGKAALQGRYRSAWLQVKDKDPVLPRQ